MKNAELSRVRELLVGSEQRELESLRSRFEEVETIYKRIQSQLSELEESKDRIDRRVRTMERGEEFVGKNLPGALNLHNKSEEDRAALIETLTENVEECLEKSVENDRVKVAQTLAPAVDLILDNRHTSLRQAISEKFSFGKKGSKKLLWGILGALALIGCTLLVFGTLKNNRWERAITALEEKPGIEILDAESSFFGKGRIIGLRDPKADDPAEVLAENGIDAKKQDIRFVDYLSLNTPFAQTRNATQKAYFEDQENRIVGAVGDLAEASMNVQQTNLERMTQAIFRVRFPEAVKQGAQISIENDQWYLKGTLEEPLFSEVIEELPNLKLTGEVNTEKLLNTTEKRLGQVRDVIGETTFIFLSGVEELSEDGLRQEERVAALAKEHTELVAKLGVAGARFEVHALPLQGNAPGNRKLESMRIEKVESILKAAGISSELILPGVSDPEQQEGRVGAYVKVIIDDAKDTDSSE